MLTWATRTLRLWPVFAAVVIVLAACGPGTFSSPDGSATDVAEELIESQALAQRLGLDQLSEASCVEPLTEEVGEQFVCTSRLDDRAVLFNVLIDDKESVFASPVNVVTGDLVEDFARDALVRLNEDNGFDFPAGSLDCGTASVILDDRQSMMCVLTDPESGVQFDTTLQVNARNGTFAVEVGQPIE